ncbi:MAG: SUMF1/EgtB/PvdO family nonheme iron enzyme [Phycisphaerae bacterium]|nr:SUMF1/EgtB/PvdO family nonheme iron enzyme [Saprospiraceae bacterium]
MPERSGKDYAVFFYVTEFQPGWPTLPETEIEAKALQKELDIEYGFKCELVANPTKQDIRQKIREYNARMTENDQVLFFFSMHGHYDPGLRDRGYLIANDGLSDDAYRDTWLSYDDLRSDLAECRAKHILLALDACHSGSFGIRSKSIPDGPAYNQEDDCVTKINKTFKYMGRQYCSSGNKETKTPAKSLFASQFLEALRKGNDGKMLRFHDLLYWLGKVENPQPESGTFSGHDPGGDFVFVRKNACVSMVDRDGDTVPDTLDQCPDNWGSQANGCPATIKGAGETMQDLQAWKTAKQQNTETAYKEYLRQFPKGEFREDSNTALRNLEDEAMRASDNMAWDLALEKNSLVGYKKYLSDYPAGLHYTEVQVRIGALEVMNNMVLVKGNTFSMGSSSYPGEKPVHQVTLSDFYISKNEITLAEFKTFIDATGYQTDADKEGGSKVFTDKWKEKKGVNWKCDTRGNIRPLSEYNHPVIHVSWNDASAYCEWVSKKSGNVYHLPTEAEWEYAASGGEVGHTKGTDKNDEKSLSRFANFEGIEDGYANTSIVGSLESNALGIFDMSGNVSEWCLDWYDIYRPESQDDPRGPSNGSYRIFRGGSWGSIAQSCRITFRNSNSPNYRSSHVGFRVARSK